MGKVVQFWNLMTKIELGQSWEKILFLHVKLHSVYLFTSMIENNIVRVDLQN